MTMMLFLGVDGGGTGCRARLADEDGRVLGEGAAGSANLTLGFETASAAILAAINQSLETSGLANHPRATIHAGFGLAGANVLKLADTIRTAPFGFASQSVESDAYIACLGAHAGADGAILILGTGSQGLVMQDGVARAIGGWGFALSDDGSGAIIGRAGLRVAILAHDDLAPRTALTTALLAGFDGDPAAAVLWARTATPRDYGAFAPMIFDHAAAGDPVGRDLVAAAAASVEAMVRRLAAMGAPAVVLMGGMSSAYERWLPESLKPLLTLARGDALDGALALARRGAGR